MTLLSDASSASGVTFAFTERSGGVSAAPFASLNLGDRCGDDPAAVAENRRRALAAIGAERCAANLVVPHQVHGDRVVVVRDSGGPAHAAALEVALAGADAVVCTAPDVPVLLCFADCVPIVVCGPGGFAVAHSGWRGTIARIAEKTVRALAGELGCAAADLKAYVGPHIGGTDYEVSAAMVRDFTSEFGEGVCAGAAARRRLDLAYAVACSLIDAGITRDNLAVWRGSTASSTDRFFSYRAEDGRTGRHAALAVMTSAPAPAWEPLENE